VRSVVTAVDLLRIRHDLDEGQRSLTALDFKTDSLLRAALEREIGDATVVIVAQRVGTIMGADRIVVLDGGTIVGTGTHAELIKQNGLYRHIYDLELKDQEEALGHSTPAAESKSRSEALDAGGGA